jgi:single-strand DNA-binding protein
MVNKVTLLGNVGKEPEVITFENGNKVAKFSLATSESYKDKADVWQQKTEWHNITVFKPSDRICGLTKGSTLFIEGKISYGKYTTKDGVEKYFTEIIASNVKVIGGAKSNVEGSITQGLAQQQQQTETVTEQQQDTYQDDLPF